MVRTSRDAAKNALGIKSPSRVFAGIGKNVSLGLAQGINAGGSEAVKAMAGVANSLSMNPSLSSDFSALDSSGGGSSVQNNILGTHNGS